MLPDASAEFATAVDSLVTIFIFFPLLIQTDERGRTTVKLQQLFSIPFDGAG
jgi:hypothetical protein